MTTNFFEPQALFALQRRGLHREEHECQELDNRGRVHFTICLPHVLSTQCGTMTTDDTFVTSRRVFCKPKNQISSNLSAAYFITFYDL